MNRLVILMLSLLLASCASFEWSIPSIHKSRVDASNSVVVLSTWAPGKSIGSASEIGIRRVSDGKVVGAPIDNHALQPHFRDGWGLLSAFELPPGEYVLFLSAVNPYMSYDASNAPFKFTLRGNEPVYLGEAHFRRENGHGVVRMFDRSERDLPMFIAKNLSFSREDFVTMLPTR